MRIIETLPEEKLTLYIDPDNTIIELGGKLRYGIPPLPSLTSLSCYFFSLSLFFLSLIFVFELREMWVGGFEVGMKLKALSTFEFVNFIYITLLYPCTFYDKNINNYKLSKS